jgi:hypothetical protein
MWTKLCEEIASRHLFEGVPPNEPVSVAELAELPPAARAYMSFYGVVAGQAKHWSFCMRWKGRFRMAPGGPWMPIDAVQYDQRSPVARVSHMKARMKHVLPVLARDTYVDGRGRMLGKIADLVPIVDGSGPEFDQGELVTWLNDCVLFAPSMLLLPGTRWSHVDATSFDIAFTDRASTVRARVFLDDHGGPIDFETTDRFLNDPDDPKHPLVRGRWSTPVAARRETPAGSFPTRGRAVWHLASGDFSYAEFELLPASLVFDVPPTPQNLSGALAA